MPHTRSAAKRLRRDRGARQRNARARSSLRTAVRKVRHAPDAGSAKAALVAAYSALDKGIRKGIVHRNTVARWKSRLSKLVAGMG